MGEIRQGSGSHKMLRQVGFVGTPDTKQIYNSKPVEMYHSKCKMLRKLNIEQTTDFYL